MRKRIIVLFLTFIIIFSFSSCKEKSCKDLFDELNFSLETLSSWQAEIKYIDETRGTFEDTYTKVKYNEANPGELLSLINCFEGAQVVDSPDSFIFSAEGMSEYIINFYLDDVEEPALSFYYFAGENILTRVIRSFDEEKQLDVLEYEYYTPYGDLLSKVQGYRQIATEPTSEKQQLSLNQKQLIAAVDPEELEERMIYIEDEYQAQEDAEMGEIAFEIYDGELPEDEGTGCKLYSYEDIETLEDNELVILARHADEKGDIQELIVTFIEYNTIYTIVTVSYPNTELLAELGVKVDNAVKLNRESIDINKKIVFVDDQGEVIYVIVPFQN